MVVGQKKEMATSKAPAGHTYRSIEEAGQCTLEQNAGSFPDTNNSWMIPPLFKTQYPEPIDERTGETLKTGRTLTKTEENRFRGMTRNMSGEEAEYKAFQAFEKLVNAENEPPLLVMRNYVLKNFKADALALELKGINFKGILSMGEFDAVVVVKNLGLVLVEVKRQHTEEQLAKAELQLENGKFFFKRFMSQITGSTRQLPVVKIIMFPDELSSSPSKKSALDSCIMYQDILENFPRRWNDIIIELQTLKGNYFLDSHEFRRFVHIATGIWCMEKYKKSVKKYNNNEASSTYQLQQNDTMVERAVLTYEAKSAKNETNIAAPVVNVELCRPQDGFPKCVGIHLIYLTPEQKNLYQNVPQAIIRGPAGSGKTLLSYLKIIDILQNHSDKKILIIAPDPHHLRMEQFAKSNGSQPTVIKTFPPTVSSGVVIITLDNFFRVSPETLQSYDVSMYHVFIDDLQSLHFLYSSYAFDEVAKFIKKSYTNVIGSDQIFWCCLDEGQSYRIAVNKGEVTYWFNTDEETPQHLGIPIYILNKVLRNSVEISKVVQNVLEMRVAQEHATSYVIINSTIGHRIRSGTVTYHKLTMWACTDSLESKIDWNSHGVQFAVERVKEELIVLTRVKDHKLAMSDIAVLLDNGASMVADPIRDMLAHDFSITPQTIKEYITTKNNTIICDFHTEVASFECACVLYLCGDTSREYRDPYNIMTRARTKLVVVDFDYKQRPPLLTKDVIMKKSAICYL